MPSQRQLPGGTYLNESGTGNQSQTPGGPFVEDGPVEQAPLVVVQQPATPRYKRIVSDGSRGTPAALTSTVIAVPTGQLRLRGHHPAVNKNPTYGYRDQFSTGPHFNGRSPDVGGAYTAPYADDLTLWPISGGFADGNTTAPYAASAISGVPPPIYSLYNYFKLTAEDPAAFASQDVAARLQSGDIWLIHLRVFYNASIGGLGATVDVSDDMGGTLFDSGLINGLEVHAGEVQCIRADVSPSGTVFTLDDVVIATTATFPPVPPDSVALDTYADTPSVMRLDSDEVGLSWSGVSIASPVGELTLANLDPTVVLSNNKIIKPPTGHLYFIGQAPAFAVTHNVIINVPTGEL